MLHNNDFLCSPTTVSKQTGAGFASTSEIRISAILKWLTVREQIRSTGMK
jgi:hypothetical protein